MADAQNHLALVIFSICPITLNYRYSFTVNFHSFLDDGIIQPITFFIIVLKSIYIINGKAATFIFRLFAQSHMSIQ